LLVTLALLGRDRRNEPLGLFEVGEHRLRLLLVANADGIAALLEQLGIELRRHRPSQAGKDVPVLFGNERADLTLAVADQFQCDRLHATGAQAAAHLVPQQWTDLVTNQPIEDAPRPLSGDHLDIDRPGVLEGVEHRLLGDFVERQPMDSALLAGQFLDEMPADRLTFAVRVGRDVDVGGVLGRILQLFDDLLA
jgi:hypothetical protein